ncbi:glutathione S-transferase family protein [Marinicella sp. W31]|uniref:glutathione S-transferase family protein n=1 Tax=Marinicella sp. W31 TaxID=3023713 RepID=UPI00375814E9
MPDSIQLYGFRATLGLPDPSPFVVKTETYLRMLDVPYTKISHINNLRKAPKKKLPYIVDGNNTIADTEFIIEYLKDHHQLDLDQWLSDTQKSQAYLMRKSLDENFYWCLVYSRWAVDQSWANYKKALLADLPWPVSKLAPPIVRRGMLKTIKKQGLGRHSLEEVKTITNKTFSALSNLLADQRYFFGDQPSSLDASVFAFVGGYTRIKLETPFTALALQHQNLVEFCDRVHDAFFKEN